MNRPGCCATVDGAAFNRDALVRQLVLVPNGIENAAATGKAKAENPGEIPH